MIQASWSGGAFLNLVAEETKVIETFDSSGRLNKRHEIVSDLLVYQSPRSSGEQRNELRDVRSVDGKPVNNRDKRILDLIRQAAKTDSVEKELARIARESQRYDGDCSVDNTTAYPGSFAFAEKSASCLRPQLPNDAHLRRVSPIRCNHASDDRDSRALVCVQFSFDFSKHR